MVFDSYWGYLYYLVFLLQLLCIIHVFKTGRSYLWILAILIFQFLGLLFYYIIEILPHQKTDLSIPVPNSMRIRSAEQAVEELDSWDNKSALAELYARAHRHEEAIALLEPALSTPHKKDPYILYALSLAYFDSDQYDKATTMLEKIDETERKELQKERSLLRGMIYESEKKWDVAEKFYKEAISHFDGEEAKCRYGLFLVNTGREEEAKEQFQKILDSAKKAPSKYKKDEKDWIGLAKSGIRSIDQKLKFEKDS